MFNDPLNQKNRSLTQLRCTLASPDVIRSWSYGEVKNPETINYRHSKPETGGLFCARIFGPTSDFECLCGRYKKSVHQGVVCEKCKVECTLKRVRRDRMGHIELAAPVAHIWFLKAAPSKIAMALDLSQKAVEKVVYFENFIVVEPGRTSHSVYDILTEAEVEEATSMDDEYFKAMTGAEAIQLLLKRLKLDDEIAKIQVNIQNNSSELSIRKLSKRLKLLQSAKKSGVKLEWMIMTTLPVLPPELRPLVVIEGGHFTSSDLNDLYRRVINRNNRLMKLREQDAPLLIVRNETRMLQEAVDSLLDNGRRGAAVTGNNKRKLKSLSEMVRGKSGRFRQNLLGKRVDYSGRSVIVVGANLKLHQCGLPKMMALELFQPFVLGQLEQRGFAATPREARLMIEKREKEVWNILNDILYQYPVLLNRAPTLHRLGIQAFEPILTEGKAIQVHPLVCTAFNADFDGDQMAVHVPLTYEAQAEARILMMSSNNILSPATGKPIIVPSKDIVAGHYYLTRESVGAKGENSTFASSDQVDLAYSNGEVALHAKIKLLVEELNQEGQLVKSIKNTTVGRALLSKILPKGFPFDKINRTLKKKDLENLVNEVFVISGLKDTVVFADQLMYMGFDYASKSGMSFALEHLKVPSSKTALINSAQEEVNAKEKERRQGVVTASEANNQIIDIWSKAADSVGADMMDNLQTEFKKLKSGKTVEEESFNPIYMYADSGARGSSAQIRQLAGMRGLMSRPDGSIIPTPIKANFREGQNVMEYFMSTHGARKGLSDTALKTANSGYLTRRLVDVAHDQVVRTEDCGTTNSVNLRPVIEGGQVVEPLHDRLYGRVISDQILSSVGDVLLDVGTMIDHSNLQIVKDANLTDINVRSVVTCDAELGVCATCYGMDLGRGKRVTKGEAIGVVAAQSIGEPGTQLTMRTFHVAGAASREAITDNLKVSHDGIIDSNLRTIKREDGNFISQSRRGELLVKDAQTGRILEKHNIQFGAILTVQDGDSVKSGDQICDWDPHTRPIIARASGLIKFGNIVRNMTAMITEDQATGQDTVSIIPGNERPKELEDKDGKVEVRDPCLIILNEKGEEISSCPLEDFSRLHLSEGDEVKAGEIVAIVPLESVKNRDITGGLTRVIDLFEARVPKEKSILAPVSGRVVLGKILRRKQIVTIIPNEEGAESTELSIPEGRFLAVQTDDTVDRGDIIADGIESQQDILEFRGKEELMNYVVREVQNVYRSQGVDINDKHIEVIVSQMIRNVEITEPGDSHLNWNDIASAYTVKILNQKIVEDNGRPAHFRRILQGITKAALHTSSFISAASFQETTRVLSEAAIMGATDDLIALKENVILGQLVPCGTGLAKHHSQQFLQPQVTETNIQESEHEAGEALRQLDQAEPEVSQPAAS